ncbi:ABC transporter substrate-binding protein [Microbacterium betulae]|uniref:ABC transporter substrate-binding protein n=1 Tax=Microbacterium betulae TaxID=2981139 RepID=A0AA97FHD9_9MICO|nr:ABC transporter substrate-binding protein [Microbacterium sp. AB]WOF23035.1 ABC transporter substrate-binding protein [Microbacterium sp. AB]
MRLQPSARPRPLAAAAVLAAGVLVAGCAGQAAPSGEGGEGLTPVSFALDWAPNTNHIGVYVADALGYFQDEGLRIEILPYGSASSPGLVSAGEADFGIGGQASVQLGRTAGLDIVSVLAVTQSDTGRLVALGDRSDIARPADLDGGVFGGFGSPLYGAIAETVIVGDGGEGDFEEVVLDTGAYEALSQGRIDFTLSVSTWEDVQADLDGHPYTAFRYQDYGLPEQQSTGVISSDAYVEEHPDEAAGFVRALQRGYAYAAENPGEAADILIEANPDTLGAAEELVRRSAELMATDGYLTAQGREVGEVDPVAWEEFGAFLVENGLLVDAEGETVAEAPDWTAYYAEDLAG